MQERNILQYLFITLKGMGMGIAEIVPGVSGGTIAFVAGIYEEFISSINNVNLKTFKVLKQDGFKAFWQALNGNFLVALFLGMGISIVSFSALIKWLLEHHPIPVWSFFFGIVLASVIFVAKGIEKWNITTIVIFIIGAVSAYFITTLPPSSNTDSLAFLFLSGAIAVCAMILPGISGAFILVLLGSYETVLGAVGEKDFKVLLTVALGCVFGLLSFAKVLKWMFTKYRDITLALLTGFILGSLNKIWPWKKVLETRTYGDKVKVIDDLNVSPYAFEGENHILMAAITAVIGFALIFILEKVASKEQS